MSVIERIESLLLWRGRQVYEADAEEPMSALEHALQTAQLAEWDDAEAALVAAAFVHDIGRLLPTPPDADPADDVHELRAVAFLSEGFGSSVVEPVRLHVQAKRYLVARDPAYRARLSATSQRSLSLQGGPMTDFEIQLFESLPHADDAVRLRLWDDLAKQPGKRTAPLEYFLAMLEPLQRQAPAPAKLQIASFSVA